MVCGHYLKSKHFLRIIKILPLEATILISEQLLSDQLHQQWHTEVETASVSRPGTSMSTPTATVQGACNLVFSQHLFPGKKVQTS